MRDYAELINQLRECGTRRDCLECPYDSDKSYCIEPRIIQAADAIEELLAELVTIRNQLPKWISVEERLPETDHEVLVCCVNSFYPEDRWVHVDWVEENGKWSQHDIVTHWMPKPPLPAPPKGVE